MMFEVRLLVLLTGKTNLFHRNRYCLGLLSRTLRHTEIMHNLVIQDSLQIKKEN